MTGSMTVTFTDSCQIKKRLPNSERLPLIGHMHYPQARRVVSGGGSGIVILGPSGFQCSDGSHESESQSSLFPQQSFLLSLQFRHFLTPLLTQQLQLGQLLRLCRFFFSRLFRCILVRHDGWVEVGERRLGQAAGTGTVCADDHLTSAPAHIAVYERPEQLQIREPDPVT